ncbi:DUF397 domain-containing protein [Streptomyces sp. TRM68416]|uniref:DUF397 domain-containing protein n=1 Tax=Streptomyces sp. TRM68416 TaxID=2758412 RepID=UPI0016619B53|nr:DUF397 domain-containing protein [Streptomyces sp. TRM68416]MBD0844814.1 DUF397 domain-containing protein [Streptomyces sp. TRM68416]
MALPQGEGSVTRSRAAARRIASLHTRIAIRDSRDRTRTPLSFPSEAFTAFIMNLKTDGRPETAR